MALLMKIFYSIQFFFKASEKQANCWKTLDGKIRQFAHIIQMFAKENEEAPLLMGLHMVLEAL